MSLLASPPVNETETINRFRNARRDPRFAVLEGLHAYKHAVRFGARILEVLSPDPESAAELAERLAPDIASRLVDEARAVDRDLFESLSPSPPGTGVLALAERPEVDPEEILQSRERAPVVLLERTSHLGNLGAAVRVAAAVGATGLVALDSKDPWHPTALRGAAGLHFALPVAAADALPPLSRPLVAFHDGGEPLVPADLPSSAVFAFGSERTGLSSGLVERADRVVEIPMAEGVSSLNLATAVAVALYAWKLNEPRSGIPAA